VLSDLSRHIGAIGRGQLSEGDVYRRERLYAESRAAFGPPGVLSCPICGTAACRFLPFGLAGRRNARCPGCGSVERHRFLWVYLRDHTRLLRRRARVLHVAPERWLMERLRALPHLSHLGTDRFSPLADVAADLTRLPFATGRFDLVLCSHVLEHIPDDAAAIAEIARVLRPGGRAVVMVPYDPKGPTQEGRAIADPRQRLALFGHPYHWRINGNDFPDRLRAAGLVPTVVDSRRLLSGHRRRRWRINRNHLFDCVRVGA
jgi:SAM-dependent methyltransferase